MPALDVILASSALPPVVEMADMEAAQARAAARRAARLEVDLLAELTRQLAEGAANPVNADLDWEYWPSQSDVPRHVRVVRQVDGHGEIFWDIAVQDGAQWSAICRHAYGETCSVYKAARRFWGRSSVTRREILEVLGE